MCFGNLSNKVNKVVPKNTFYEKLNISNIIRQEFFQKLEKIVWKYKISQDNTNILKTDKVEEIEIFEMILKEKYDAKNIINVITKAIPYPILFKITYKNEFRYAIKYDNEIIYSEWNKDIELTIKGFDLSIVYANFVKQIGNIENNITDVKQEIQKIKEIEKLEKEISKLKSNIQKEKQFNRKVELNNELNRKKEIINGYINNIQ